MATKTISLTLLLGIAWTASHAQADIDNLGIQEYLQAKGVVIYKSTAPEYDPLVARNDARITFQKSDSLLLLTYAALLLKAQNHDVNGLGNKIIKTQERWNDFRKQHCAIVYDSHRGCGDCHEREIDYLACMTELTDARVRELEKLYGQLVE